MSAFRKPPRPLRALEWVGERDGFLRIVDQTRLPQEIRYLHLENVEAVREAIVQMRLRGAPAIGVAAAFGVVLGMRQARYQTAADALAHLERIVNLLRGSRPTAVNLHHALERMYRVGRAIITAADFRPLVNDLVPRLLAEAKAIWDEDRLMCRTLAAHGAALIQDGMGILTHCNTGALAASDYGTALGVLFTAYEQGRRFTVYACETRPLWQGARLTTLELKLRGLECVLLCDNAAGWFMRQGKIQLVLVGADRIAANGDTANKVGTYSLAALARVHGIPFYVAAPSTTFDLSTPDGSAIPIEQRSAQEVTQPFGLTMAPEGIRVENPAFDVTPADWITGIITERGLVQPVNPSTITACLGLTCRSEKSIP
ncbi:MAG: S-methyl-5-thioribose-1-phosphate isomerase [Gemmatales bacterium]|nr:S-methyl-5-thioribose-1-phosphate isomerase [Gemmatales bacterium]MDW8176133.1 S-methyl-5-thioribose-1-phosphate isomerase [Gemmatales bacterium]